MEGIVLSLAIFISKCLSFLFLVFVSVFSHPWTFTLPMTDIVFGTVMFGPKKWPSLRNTWGKSYRAILKETTLGRSADAQAARTRTLRIILFCKVNLFTFIPVWRLRIIRVAILQAAMSLVTLSQCWLVIFQDNLIDNLEIIQKTTWAKMLSKSHISPQPIKRPQLFKNSNESRCRCCGGIYRRKLSYLVTFSVTVLYLMWSLNLLRIYNSPNKFATIIK